MLYDFFLNKNQSLPGYKNVSLKFKMPDQINEAGCAIPSHWPVHQQYALFLAKVFYPLYNHQYALNNLNQ